jgi:MerR family copper efflux transcriptional regulator
VHQPTLVPAALRIGALARASGASPKALRLYEAQGLLGRVERRGSYRVYSTEQLQRVRLIRMAQTLGFKLSELGWIASADWAVALQRMQTRRRQLDAELQRLQQQRVLIEQAIEEIETCPELRAAGLQACTLPANGQDARAGA